MNKIIFYFSVLIFISFGACQSKENQSALHLASVVAQKKVMGGDTLMVSDYGAFKEKVDVPLSSLVSSLNVVLLDNSDEALMAADGLVTVTENYIGLSSFSARAYKLFDKKGKYLHTITRVGTGPNEYTMALYDSYIDESNQRIYLLSNRAKKIMVFDMEGNPQHSIPLPYLVHKGRMRIDSENKKVTLFALPFEDTPSVIWEQDFEGHILQEIPSGHFVISPGDYNNEVGDLFNTSFIDFSTFYFDNRKDSLYHYNSASNRLEPVFTLELGKEGILDLYTELPGYYLVTLYTTSDREELKYPQLLVDKNTGRGAFVHFKLDMLGDIEPGPSYYFSRGYFIALISSDELKDKLETVMATPDKLTSEVAENIQKLQEELVNEEDLVILTGKLKRN